MHITRVIITGGEPVGRHWLLSFRDAVRAPLESFVLTFCIVLLKSLLTLES